jgi:hypothetical protein
MAVVTPAQGSGRVLAQRYHLQRVLGRGAMGAVWEAEDVFLRRPVAVKEVVLPPGLSPEERAVSRERTLREARAIARLGHPNVVTLYDVLDEDARPWVVMELVPSRSLADMVKEDGSLHPMRVATVGLAILGALEAAHSAGIIHRDVKPGNILLGHDGRVKLTDFGIARAAGDTTITGTGLLIGSPSYLAPEIVRGQPAGTPCDLWGLGATLYAAVEGKAPFSGVDAMDTLSKVVQDPPAPFDRAGPLAPALRAMLEKDPARRATAVEARRRLLGVLRSGDATSVPESGPIGQPPAVSASVLAATVAAPSPLVPEPPAPVPALASDTPPEAPAGLGTPAHGAPGHGAPAHGAPGQDGAIPPTLVAAHGVGGAPERADADSRVPADGSPPVRVPGIADGAASMPGDTGLAGVAGTAGGARRSGLAAGAGVGARAGGAGVRAGAGSPAGRAGSGGGPADGASTAAAASPSPREAPAGGAATAAPPAPPAAPAAAGPAGGPASGGTLWLQDGLAGRPGATPVRDPSPFPLLDTLVPARTARYEEPTQVAASQPEPFGLGGFAEERGPVPAQPRRDRTAAAILVVAGLVVVLLVAAVIGARSMLGSSGSTTPRAGSDSPPAAPTTEGGLPSGFRPFQHPGGFSVTVPQGWTPERPKTGIIDLNDPDSSRFLRLIRADSSVSALSQLASAEPGFAKRHGDYQRLRLEKVSYRDHDAADWEFTFSRNGVLRHVLYRAIVADGASYAVYLSTAASEWAASRRIFDVAARTLDLPS